MWTVVKIKKKELNIFKKNLTEKIGKDIKFYYPKVEYHKYFNNRIKKFEKLILENYIFCHHKKFKDHTNIAQVKFIRGLEYFIDGYEKNQNEIVKFIEYCKSFENKEGYITPAFFKTMVTKKGQFVSGPFTNMMFEIIERQKNKLKILVGNIVTTISDKKNYLYRPI
jgi:hypothetical protein